MLSDSIRIPLWPAAPDSLIPLSPPDSSVLSLSGQSPCLGGSCRIPFSPMDKKNPAQGILESLQPGLAIPSCQFLAGPVFPRILRSSSSGIRLWFPGVRMVLIFPFLSHARIVTGETPSIWATSLTVRRRLKVCAFIRNILLDMRFSQKLHEQYIEYYSIT
jgi:hypothetical protein